MVASVPRTVVNGMLKYLPSVASLALMLTFTGCKSPVLNDGSNELATSVPQTTVKNQLIDNCWAYAIAGWAESLHLRATGEKVNVSETYWTYWEMYEELRKNKNIIKEIDTGAYWADAKRFISTYGLMYDRDFSTAAQGPLQEAAFKEINDELKKGGSLYDPKNRTPQNVMAALDHAFHVRMMDKKPKAINPKNFIIGKANDPKQPRNIDEAFNDPKRMWKLYQYRYVEGRQKPTAADQAARKQLLKRVMKAMNQGYPALMGVMLDFKALNDQNNTFEAKRLKGTAKAKDQGGHLIVLHDYSVTGAPDGHGGFFDISEGDSDQATRRLAAEGNVSTFVVKNSWGPRPAEGIKTGYYRFEIGYLNATWPWFDDSGTKSDSYTALGDFTLPPAVD